MTEWENLRNDGFDHNVFNLLPDQSGVDSLRTKILPQGLQSPENTHTHTDTHVRAGEHRCSDNSHIIVAKLGHRFELIWRQNYNHWFKLL